MANFEKLLSQYDYPVPPELIAQKPASPRDSAKLLIYNKKRKNVSFDTFLNLPAYLPPHSVLVLNDTKVVPARLTLKKETGGRVTILYLNTEKQGIRVLSDRHLAVGAILTLTSTISFSVLEHKEKYYILKPSFPLQKLFEVLEKYGETPLPPYIKNTPLTESSLRKEYQTIFARAKGSVAAPTASLHMSKRLLKKLERAGHTIVHITLHVNLGTFATLTEDQITQGKLHEEFYEISKQSAKLLNTARREERPIIAVGTTSVRALESAAGGSGNLKRLSGTTNLFIRPGYTFKIVQGIITNFHVPKSSLLMLVAALTGRKEILSLYQKAVSGKFRLFSFGDGMLILP